MASNPSACAASASPATRSTVSRTRICALVSASRAITPVSRIECSTPRTASAITPSAASNSASSSNRPASGVSVPASPTDRSTTAAASPADAPASAIRPTGRASTPASDSTGTTRPSDVASSATPTRTAPPTPSASSTAVTAPAPTSEIAIDTATRRPNRPRNRRRSISEPARNSRNDRPSRAIARTVASGVTQPSTDGPISTPTTISSSAPGTRSAGISPSSSGTPAATASTTTRPADTSHQLGVGMDVQQRRAVGGEEGLHAVVELVGMMHGNADGTAEPGVLGEVGVDQRGLPHRVRAGQLFLADLAEHPVVEQHVLDRDPVLDRGRQLGQVLADPAVTGHRDDRSGRIGGPGTHRRRVAEADRAEVARHEHRLPGALEVAAEGVGVVADVDGDRGDRGAMRGQGCEDGGAGNAAAPVVRGAAALLGAPDRLAEGDVGTLVDGCGVAEGVEQRLHRDCGVAEDPDADRVEPPDRAGRVVDLH